jgi:hypothetical protein
MLQTAMGSVSLKLPAATAMNLHASTAMGSVHSQFPQGASNGGGPNVDVETNMGSVSVEKE